MIEVKFEEEVLTKLLVKIKIRREIDDVADRGQRETRKWKGKTEKWKEERKREIHFSFFHFPIHLRSN